MSVSKNIFCPACGTDNRSWLDLGEIYGAEVECGYCRNKFKIIQCVNLPPAPATPMLKNKESILHEAIRLTSSDRQQTYGHPRDHFLKTTSLLNALLKDYLVKPLPVEVWPKIMILDKLARSMNMYKRDNMADVAGYAQTHEMCMED